MLITTKEHPLSIALSAAVPLHIMEMQRTGGVTDHDLETVRAFSEVLGAKGDMLLFRSKRPQEGADLFNQLARAIAVLAHCPGGVRCFGQHWEAHGAQT